MFNVQALVNILPILGKGMAGVFIVIALIWLYISLLTKLSNGRQEQD